MCYADSKDAIPMTPIAIFVFLSKQDTIGNHHHQRSKMWCVCCLQKYEFLLLPQSWLSKKPQTGVRFSPGQWPYGCFMLTSACIAFIRHPHNNLQIYKNAMAFLLLYPPLFALIWWGNVNDDLSLMYGSHTSYHRHRVFFKPLFVMHYSWRKQKLHY